MIDKIKGPNPFKIEMKSIKKLLEIGPISIMDTSIDLKSEIEKRLNEIFYNLNMLNLYDYETYEFIRQLASEQFGIELQNVYIPSQTLEQGALDILSIIRNIQGFVTKFTYNIYNQTFIEVLTKFLVFNNVKKKAESRRKNVEYGWNSTNCRLFENTWPWNYQHEHQFNL